MAMTSKEQKLIQKLLKQATEIKEIAINSNNMRETDLETIYKAQGELFFGEDTFLKKVQNIQPEWLKVSLNKISEHTTSPQLTEINDLNERLTRIEQKIREITEWNTNSYFLVVAKLKELEQAQQDIITTFREYLILKQ